MLPRPQFLDDRIGFPYKLKEDHASAALRAAEREEEVWNSGTRARQHKTCRLL